MLPQGPGQQRGPQTPAWSPVASWTRVILPGGLLQKAKLSSSWVFVAQSQGDPSTRHDVEEHLHKLQAAAHTARTTLCLSVSPREGRVAWSASAACTEKASGLEIIKFL